MEANKKRRIREGKEFDHLFPPPSEEDKTIKGQASVEDTMDLIQKTVPQTLWQTERIAKQLKGRTLEETCRNIWHFVYGHVQYKRDKDGVEQVRSPRRTWWERETGVDCDCYTEFISSILLNLNIPHKARVTKYPKKQPEIPRWQHVYPIVPKHGRWHKALTERDDYIVLDCVKDNFDDEQSYLERKDYDMRLDYLDGIEQEETQAEVQDEMHQLMDYDYTEPDNVDLADLASIYDDEELGNIFKKIGGAVKKVANKVGSAVKTVAQNIKKTAPILVKKVGDDIGKGIRFINRYVNPATVLLRNGFLLAMKVNLMNVAGRLRYAYLTDAQAIQKGINLDALKKLRAVKDRTETVYWQAGGKKENLKKGLLSGKGNKDNKVPLSGLEGLDDNVYADIDEYNIIHSDPDNLEGLGEIASGTAIAAASSAVAAIAATLKQIKGLFSKGGQEEQAFQSETDNAGTAASASATIPDDEDALVTQPHYETKSQISPNVSASQSFQPALPGSASISRRITPDLVPATQDAQVQTTTDQGEAKGFVEKTTSWAKENPGKSLLIAGAVAGGGYLLVKSLSSGNSGRGDGVNGLPSQTKKKRKAKKRAQKNNRKEVERINLL